MVSCIVFYHVTVNTYISVCAHDPSQVKLDKNAQFTSVMGTFHTKAKGEHEAMTEAKKAADTEAAALLKWLGEDAKSQPEDVFSQVRPFTRRPVAHGRYC